ncbi:MAG: CDP-alcohol phosphatidyltransferase family protein [Hyphomicrobiaceae bacterium]|nr:CDP-alcohol phosphatidyltransferase family protein [Hyphomicrobiaceae bacterium]MCC0022626.1 CDP-alcohol phosphatidyltransferase family protein [Hyphomicrobiaceae bacterium]
MLDGLARTFIDPPLNHIGRKLAGRGVTANMVTGAGLTFSLLAALAIAFQQFGFGLLLVIASRLADGLDGAVARATQKTDFGGYFDIVADFLFYGSVPLAFAIADPSANAVATAILLLSFYFNGATFLGYAILAERNRLTTDLRGQKNFYFTDGLMEGTETIVFMLIILIWPASYVWAAVIFAAATFFTGVSRMFRARQVFAAMNRDQT